MRNLRVLSSRAYSLPARHDQHVIRAATVDVDENVLLVASELVSANEVNIQVWKVDEDKLHPFATVISPAVYGSLAQIVSLTVIAETHTLCLITRSGDIAVLPLDNADLTPPLLDIVGTLTPGPVQAVAPAPDSSLLVIITGSPQTLHLMSPSIFTHISSFPLTTTDSGAAAPVNVGWGSKATQFHGTLGKSAAQAQSAAELVCTTTPDDDRMPRVSWRGDAQFFVVSACEGGGEPGKRVLRVYNRAGVLQSTAEDVPGLEHVLAWRPNGGLIAGVQRFGNVPGADGGGGGGGSGVWALGKGIENRHDVVFFERNGLRHGEFTLREPRTGTTVDSHLSSDRRWGYRVRELGWNADSSVLSVWIEREAGDVVQLWTTSNYHWYLKLELPAPISAPRVGGGDDVGVSRFTAVAWHAEDPLRVFMATSDTVLCTRIAPCTASSPSVRGSGVVGVVDGGTLLITPFRTQNVPPPMASARLSFSSPLPSNITPVSGSAPSQAQTPTTQRHTHTPPPLHIAFAPHTHAYNYANGTNNTTADPDENNDASDIVATLSPPHNSNGGSSITLWHLLTPITARKSKRGAVVSNLLWSGGTCDVREGRMAMLEGARQVCVMECGGGKGTRGCVVGVLGEREGKGSKSDVIRFIELVPNITSPAASSSPPAGSVVESNSKTDPLALSTRKPACQLCLARTCDVYMPGREGRIVDDHDFEAEGNDGTAWRTVVWQAEGGGLWEVSWTSGVDYKQQHEGTYAKDNADADAVPVPVPTPKLVARFPEYCVSAVRVRVKMSSFGSGSGNGAAPSPDSQSQSRSQSSSLFIGLAGSKLHVAIGVSNPPPDNPNIDSPHPLQNLTYTLSHACTSFAIARSGSDADPGYLIWTTTAPAHEAMFVRLGVLGDVLLRAHDVHGEKLQIEETTFTPEKRRIERGARIVTVVPSTMSLVMQMPRGNLETVMPRPLVMECVREDVKRREYRAAFLACRKHRVDQNVLVELDSTTFVECIPKFVEQLDDVDHINLFLSGLGRSSFPPETISQLCDGIREELERRDVNKFVNSILTAHVVKKPPDYEAGLALLLRLRGTHSDLVEDAVKYIIFLVDADRLFDTALGMYDFSLVLLVAQYSQKDPREYLPFLRSLRSLEGPYQHFKIDDHLKRYVKALSSLHRAGPERFEEAKGYVEKHGLYSDAMRLWKGEREEYDAMLELYGDHLFDRREFKAAALAFIQSSRVRKAMVAYEKALDWQELFDLVVRQGIEDDKILSIASRVADDLGSKQRHVDAARVLLDYVGDVDRAVGSLVRGGAWSEARRVAALHKRDDLVTLSILPGALEARSSISDEVLEIRELMDRQVGRLDELAGKKISAPDAFYGVEDANLTNVDVMTDVSNPGTMFTRYTVAPTSSDRSRRTSRSKRKLDRKAGRKGTVEEEEYLLQSLGKLVVRLDIVRAECRALLPHLLSLSEEHAGEASELQVEVEVLEQTMQSSIERIWTKREEGVGLGSSGGQYKDRGEAEVARQVVKPTDKVPKPSLSDVPWKVGWIGVGDGD